MASTNLMNTCKRIITAIRQKGVLLTFNNKQFIGRNGTPHNYFCINKAEWNAEKGRYDHTEVFSSGSIVQIVVYLRDLWYEINGWELPDDGGSEYVIKARQKAEAIAKRGQ